MHQFIPKSYRLLNKDNEAVEEKGKLMIYYAEEELDNSLFMTPTDVTLTLYVVVYFIKLAITSIKT